MKPILVVSLHGALQKTQILNKTKDPKVYRVGDNWLDAGGKGGNTARALVKLGYETDYLTLLPSGGGKTYLSLLNEAGVSVKGLEVPGELRTCTTLIDPHAGDHREIIETSQFYDTVCAQELIANRLLEHYSWTIISGSLPNCLELDQFYSLISHIRKISSHLLFDLADPLLGHLLPVGPDWIRINQQEYDSALEKTKKLIQESQTSYMVSNGSSPLILFHGDCRHALEPPSTQVISSIGAGDIFNATFVAEMLNSPENPVFAATKALEIASHSCQGPRPIVL